MSSNRKYKELTPEQREIWDAVESDYRDRLVEARTSMLEFKKELERTRDILRMIKNKASVRSDAVSHEICLAVDSVLREEK